MKRFMCLVTILVIVALASAPAFAFDFIVESRSGGQNFSGFTTNVTTVSATACTAPGLTAGLGTVYSTSTNAGKWAQYAYTPAAAGYYDVYAAWVSSTNGWVKVDYTVNGTITTRWNQNQNPTQLGVSGGAKGNTWNALATGVALTGGAQSTVYQTINDLTAPGGNATTSYRMLVAAAKWSASTPGAATNGAFAGNMLSWTAGNYSSFFDVYLDTAADPATKIGSNLVAGTTSIDAGTLAAGTTYYWKVVAKNVDVNTSSQVFSFTTAAAVPEPGSLLALGTGLIGLIGIIRRRRS